MKSAHIPWLMVVLALAVPTTLVAQESAEGGVSATLDALHELASQADGEGYFALFAEDGIFLGTDATERWTVEEFRAYAMPYFSQGRGWTYESTERHISVSADGSTAWFDERLQNSSLGETRGSGVLIRRDEGWKIAQYNLTIPIPNALAGDVVRQIRELDAVEEEPAP